MLISEIGISDQIELIESQPFANEDAFLSANPLGKVPCLTVDGESILDSEVICDYLDANFTGGTFFNPIYADWRLKVLYSISSGVMDASVALRMEEARESDGLKSEFWMSRYQQSIEKTLIHIESKLILLPDEYCILHINLLANLAYLDFRHPGISWRDRHSELASFYEQHSRRESFQQNPLKG